MTTSQFSSSVLQNSPLRYIGKIPVFKDDIGEFAKVEVKLYFISIKKFTTKVIKVDPDLNVIRNAYELSLTLPNKSAKKNTSMKYIAYKQGSKYCATLGVQSIPAILYGNSYHGFRHNVTDPLDFRKHTFHPHK